MTGTDIPHADEAVSGATQQMALRVGTPGHGKAGLCVTSQRVFRGRSACLIILLVGFTAGGSVKSRWMPGAVKDVHLCCLRLGCDNAGTLRHVPRPALLHRSLNKSLVFLSLTSAIWVLWDDRCSPL